MNGVAATRRLHAAIFAALVTCRPALWFCPGTIPGNGGADYAGRLWQQQAAWRAAHPDRWWASAPESWSW